MEYIVIEDHKTEYPNPIIIKRGERIIIEKEYEGNDDWPNWIFCIKMDGSNKGWIPKQIIKYEDTYGLILEDYSAREMSIKKGNIIEGIKECNGWLWSKDKNTNEIGWIPINKVKKLEEGTIKREKMIQEYFYSWIIKDITTIEKYFDRKIIYSECYGPEYQGIDQVKEWFNDWNKENTVLQWDIKQCIHQDNITVVEWFFECKTESGKDCFDGNSIIEFNKEDKIVMIKEFQSKVEHYFPYKNK